MIVPSTTLSRRFGSSLSVARAESVATTFRLIRSISRNPPAGNHYGLKMLTSSAMLQVTKHSTTLPRLSSFPRTAVVQNAVCGGGDLIEATFNWCTNLGAPAALVAGAVIATIYDYISNGTLNVNKSDRRIVRVGKTVTYLLLITSFVFEVLSIFGTTVFSTMLLSRTVESMATIRPVTEATTPLMFLEANFEFEYLSARIFFLQGLLNWLAAVAIGLILPMKTDENQSPSMFAPRPVTPLNKFVATSLVTTIVAMLSFYNTHMTFYSNYGEMLLRWTVVAFRRIVWRWPPRPLCIVFVPSMILTVYWGIWAFVDELDGHES